MLDAVVGDTSPPLSPESGMDAKTSRERDIKKAFARVSRGQYKAQFTPERMADATALVERRWDHFSSGSGMLPSHGRYQWLPRQLGADMLRRKLRTGLSDDTPLSALRRPSVSHASCASHVSHVSHGSGESPMPSGMARPSDKAAAPPTQRRHLHAASYQLLRGRGVEEVVRQAAPKTTAELKALPMLAGTFVVTAAASSSPLGRASEILGKIPYWLWRVLRIHRPGSALCREKKKADQHLYECHLHGPAIAKARVSMCVPMRPFFDMPRTNLIIKTPAEKAAATSFQQRVRAKKKQAKNAKKQAIKKKRQKGDPLIALLRDDNIWCKGFSLTTGKRIPPLVRKYADSLK